MRTLPRWQLGTLAARAAGIVLLSSAAAVAQTSPDHRVAVTVSGGERTTAVSFSQAITFEAFSEQGSLTSDYKIARLPFGDVSVTVRIWRGFGAGVAVSYLEDSFPAHITALIPHPIIVNQPRTVSGDAGVTHRETIAHLQAVYWLQPARRLDVMLSAGPSMIRADQDFVADVSYAQTFPYNTATFQGATVARERKTAVGFNIGGDAGWTLAGPFGVVALARYSRVITHFSSIGAESVALGGLNVGGGLRLRF